MIGSITLKVCGITSVNDAVTSAGIGADWLGFIFYPDSPRHVTEAKFKVMAAQLPTVKKVAVCVEPAPPDLARLGQLGFDAFQVHFRPDLPLPQIAAWSEAVGISRLWLAPKLPPGQDVKAEWLPLARTFLLDTFHPDKFGGTGQTGDWAKYERHAAAHPATTWILSGGLNPDNVAAAVAATDTLFIDVSSGVESSPGLKCQEKLFAFWRALGHR
ncbi:MAG: phosphoribosylanthranilate isomerase [Candidatus Didemnitutus sp.]|nr:phosphoribosylanthranilate isomerase [Candidatus Didemnitutus sp.]